MKTKLTIADVEIKKTLDGLHSEKEISILERRFGINPVKTGVLIADTGLTRQRLNQIETALLKDFYENSAELMKLALLPFVDLKKHYSNNYYLSIAAAALKKHTKGVAVEKSIFVNSKGFKLYDIVIYLNKLIEEKGLPLELSGETISPKDEFSLDLIKFFIEKKCLHKYFAFEGNEVVYKYAAKGDVVENLLHYAKGSYLCVKGYYDVALKHDAKSLQSKGIGSYTEFMSHLSARSQNFAHFNLLFNIDYGKWETKSCFIKKLRGGKELCNFCVDEAKRFLSVTRGDAVTINTEMMLEQVEKHFGKDAYPETMNPYSLKAYLLYCDQRFTSKGKMTVGFNDPSVIKDKGL